MQCISAGSCIDFAERISTCNAGRVRKKIRVMAFDPLQLVLTVFAALNGMNGFEIAVGLTDL